MLFVKMFVHGDEHPGAPYLPGTTHGPSGGVAAAAADLVTVPRVTAETQHPLS